MVSSFAGVLVRDGPAADGSKAAAGAAAAGQSPVLTTALNGDARGVFGGQRGVFGGTLVVVDGFLEVRFVGGSHDGVVKAWPARMVDEGCEHRMPRRLNYGVADLEAPTEEPGSGWERYVFREGVRGWVATLVPDG